MRNWVRLFFSVVSIWCFIKFIPVGLNQIQSYKKITDYSMKLGIDNAALFYSEELHTSEAELELKNRLNTTAK